MSLKYLDPGKINQDINHLMSGVTKIQFLSARMNNPYINTVVFESVQSLSAIVNRTLERVQEVELASLGSATGENNYEHIINQNQTYVPQSIQYPVMLTNPIFIPQGNCPPQNMVGPNQLVNNPEVWNNNNMMHHYSHGNPRYSDPQNIFFCMQPLSQPQNFVQQFPTVDMQSQNINMQPYRPPRFIERQRQNNNRQSHGPPQSTEQQPSNINEFSDRPPRSTEPKRPNIIVQSERASQAAEQQPSNINEYSDGPPQSAEPERPNIIVQSERASQAAEQQPSNVNEYSDGPPQSAEPQRPNIIVQSEEASQAAEQQPSNVNEFSDRPPQSAELQRPNIIVQSEGASQSAEQQPSNVNEFSDRPPQSAELQRPNIIVQSEGASQAAEQQPSNVNEFSDRPPQSAELQRPNIIVQSEGASHSAKQQRQNNTLQSRGPPRWTESKRPNIIVKSRGASQSIEQQRQNNTLQSDGPPPRTVNKRQPDQLQSTQKHRPTSNNNRTESVSRTTTTIQTNQNLQNTNAIGSNPSNTSSRYTETASSSSQQQVKESVSQLRRKLYKKRYNKKKREERLKEGKTVESEGFEILEFQPEPQLPTPNVVEEAASIPYCTSYLQYGKCTCGRKNGTKSQKKNKKKSPRYCTLLPDNLAKTKTTKSEKTSGSIDFPPKTDRIEEKGTKVLVSIKESSVEEQMASTSNSDVQAEDEFEGINSTKADTDDGANNIKLSKSAKRKQKKIKKKILDKEVKEDKELSVGEEHVALGTNSGVQRVAKFKGTSSQETFEVDQKERGNPEDLADVIEGLTELRKRRNELSDFVFCQRNQPISFVFSASVKLTTVNTKFSEKIAFLSTIIEKDEIVLKRPNLKKCLYIFSNILRLMGSIGKTFEYIYNNQKNQNELLDSYEDVTASCLRSILFNERHNIRFDDNIKDSLYKNMRNYSLISCAPDIRMAVVVENSLQMEVKSGQMKEVMGLIRDIFDVFQSVTKRAYNMCLISKYLIYGDNFADLNIAGVNGVEIATVIEDFKNVANEKLAMYSQFKKLLTEGN